MERLKTLEPLVFSLRGVCLGCAGVVIGEREKVSLASKAYGCYWSHKISGCSLLRCPIVPLCGFRLFAAFADISFRVINKGNVMMGEVFL